MFVMPAFEAMSCDQVDCTDGLAEGLAAAAGEKSLVRKMFLNGSLDVFRECRLTNCVKAWRRAAMERAVMAVGDAWKPQVQLASGSQRSAWVMWLRSCFRAAVLHPGVYQLDAPTFIPRCHADCNKGLHYAVDYRRWLGPTGDTQYEVSFAQGMEPWYIGHRSLLPLYDVRFIGFGFNKQLQVRLLSATAL